MHTHTPSISVVDPRALLVRSVAYHRRALENPGEARVTQQRYDAAGRLIWQRDPRLFALSSSNAEGPLNLTHLFNLTSQTLCSDSVDAGWQLGLPGAAGEALESWDQRGWHRRTEHDSLLRPVAVFEQDAGEDEHCVERITWGAGSEEDVQHNRCGKTIRQDDPAGSRLMPDYGLSGSVLVEVRHFLNDFETPDWPASEAERNRLLEPGEGAKSVSRYAPTAEMVRQTDAKGHIRFFACDRAGQPCSVALQQAGQANIATLVSAIEYTASGQIEYELAGNGMCTRSTYDPANGQLIALATQGPDNVYLQKLSYAYDPAGNITEIADAALTIQHFANQRIEPVRRFTYDTLYQLISATGWESAKPSLGPALPEWQAFGPPDGSRWCNYVETYAYDEAGNLLQRLHHGAVGDTLTMHVASHSNRSVKTRPGLPGIDELFDARGNLLELQPGNALHWNGRNQLARVTQVARADGVDNEERFAYDGEGERLRKCRMTVAKTMIHKAEVRYLPGIELHANSATGELLQVVSIQAGRCTVRLLHWDSPPPAGLDNDQLRYCFDDHLGSSAFEVDAQAKTISQEVYYPYGGTAWLAGRHEVESSYKTIRYSGKERDSTGLYYYGARYYAPWLQRWLNADPAGDVDGLNFYRFVRNSPINFVDQKGFLPILRGFFDYLIERKNNVGQYVVAGGLKNIKKDYPDADANIRTSISEAKQVVKNTINVLESEGYQTEYESVFFGVGDTERLKNFYRGMLENIERLQAKPEKVVLVDNYKKVRGPLRMMHSGAFVLSGDRRRKLYFDLASARYSSPNDLLLTVLHETAHRKQKGQPDVVDSWYLETDQDNADIDYPSWGKVDERDQIAAENKSRRMMEGNEVRETDFNPVNAARFRFLSGGNDRLSRTWKFRLDPMLRTKMAQENADSYAYFSMAVGGKKAGL